MPVYASGVEEGSDLNAVVDDNEDTAPASGTCVTLAESDRPWLVVDLGQSMRVYGVTLRLPDSQGNITT